LYLLLAGIVVFLSLGLALESTSKSAMQDFAVMYFPARCLIQHCDPYKVQVMGDYHPLGTANIFPFTTRYIYLPTAFVFTVPFAMLPWGPAHIFWLTLTVVSLIVASILIWDLSASYAPIVCGVLLGIFLANSEVLVLFCNSAGIAVSFCVVAVWCFLRERFVQVGVLCLAISLAVKPQDAVMVWLFFFLAGRIYRKHALQTLFVMVVLSLPAVLWVVHVSPRWMQELHSNVLAFSEPGGINDPGLASSYAHGGAMVISLQTVASAFWNDPHIYNWATYLVCAPLLLMWAFVTLRSRPSTKKSWLALAAIAPLSMLPVTHHLYDTKLLLLTVPACAMLWAEGGLIGWFALVVNAAGFVLTGDLSQPILYAFIKHLHLASMGLSEQLLMAAQVFPVPLILLAMGIFYLWIYLRRDPERA
jgi:hypothetical protein